MPGKKLPLRRTNSRCVKEQNTQSSGILQKREKQEKKSKGTGYVDNLFSK
jgi:hypothetical protein